MAPEVYPLIGLLILALVAVGIIAAARYLPPITEVWRARLLLLGVGFLSLAPIVFHRILTMQQLYDIIVGGLHPSCLLYLRWAGQISYLFPLIIPGALLASWFRPAITGDLLVLCTAAFVLFLVFFLFNAVFVIVIYVPVRT